MGPMLVLGGVLLLILATAGLAGAPHVASHERLKQLNDPGRYASITGGIGLVLFLAGVLVILF